MFDPYKREINYLRISVTDRCNLKCVYCMPAEGMERINRFELLSLEEIVNFTKEAVKNGINKVKLTGGEPLVRKDIVNLVQQISAIPGIKDLGMTTNGILLGRFAQKLADAGLHRVNISLDTLDKEEYSRITRGGNLQSVLDGIEAALKAGLTPIKINCVIKKNRFERNARQVAAFSAEKDLQVRYIKEMDLETGTFSRVEGGDGGDCNKCNRLRLTSNGILKPCLFHDFGYAIRKSTYPETIKKAVINKPKSGQNNSKNKFYNIGG